MSPLHIKPEWYFLFAYAILRSVPNKLGGVVAMCLRVLFLYIFRIKKTKNISKKSVLCVFLFLMSCSLLTWVGGNAVEAPYIIIGQILLIFYFSFILV